MRVVSSLGLDRQMAARDVARPDLIERRMLPLAEIPRIRTALAKATAAWPFRRRGHGARDDVEPLLIVPDVRHRVHQTLGVGMVRLGEELVDFRLLHHFARIHHDYLDAVSAITPRS